MPLLRPRLVQDIPNLRSSHATPTPRGGGILVVGVTLAAWMVALSLGLFRHPAAAGVSILVAAALAAVSWMDDRRSLSPGVRLLAQLAGVAATLALLPRFTAYPPALEFLVSLLGWLWFVNLYNFMDGIDGLAAAETVGIGVSVTVISPASAWPALALAGAAVGFLVWNWPPARVFLGDVGSVPIGYLLGFLLIEAAPETGVPAVLLPPLAFLFDASVTLIRRVFRRERPWEAHRSHAYQRAARSGWSHRRITLSFGLLNVALLALSIAAVRGMGWNAVGIGGLLCGVGYLGVEAVEHQARERGDFV
jgi:UDP-N-acetylmuramyl pentapeptide phosphotransferase/UDP-N-acetylglucosamine-1-phosphate transferase